MYFFLLIEAPAGILVKGPAYTDEVGFAGLQEGFRIGRCLNAACDQDGHGNDGFNGSRHVGEIARFLVILADIAASATGKIDEVDAGFFQEDRRLGSVFNRAAARLVVTATEADGDEIIRAHSSADGGDDF